MSIDGIIVIDKPPGMTSAAVVGKVKRGLRIKRVGHTGTLDPMATGVLPLCLGQGTKVAGYLLAEDKSYEAELEFGFETDTLDAEGQITASRPEQAMAVTEPRVRQVLAGFVGPISQVPPMYSALKHKGKRLYELARAGQTVERKPRAVTIHRLDLLSFTARPSRAPGSVRPPTPRARLFVHCSKGTYVRTLAADIGAQLECGAHLTALRRVKSGAFGLDDAVELSEINEQIVRERIISPGRAVAHLPSLLVPDALIPKVANGLVLSWSQLSPGVLADPPADPLTDTPADTPAAPPDPEQVICLLAPGERLLALAVVQDDGRVRYRRVFQGSGLAT